MSHRIAIAATGAFAGLGFAACSWMFPGQRVPDDVTRRFDDLMGCDVAAERIRLVAEAQFDSGGSAEMWVAPAVFGGHVEVVREVNDDGSVASSAGCAEDSDRPEMTVRAALRGPGPDRAASTTYAGRAVDDAATVRVEFADRAALVVEVQADGYFLVIDVSGNGEPTKLEALDEHGNVIATTDNPRSM